ncbi:MAG: AAA family ATPase [Candidatus Asgardarchaeia archaeon]
MNLEVKGLSANEEINRIVEEIQKEYGIVGRTDELTQLIAARLAKKHVLIEGPVGVGKTTIGLALAKYFDQSFIRVDGDERFTETKMVGFFDPPIVLKKGWTWDAFVPGPLVKAMTTGGILFLNEVNRLPEGTQNALLPALDEGIVEIPKLGTVHAKEGFMVIATQNPEEYVGTSVLSEALKDRFIWIKLGYQSEDEEKEIVRKQTECKDEKIINFAVKVIRMTREHPEIVRGASVRGAIDIAQMIHYLGKFDVNTAIKVTIASIGKRIEVSEESNRTVEKILEEIVKSVLSENF